jgi:hypothetical protein
MNDFITGEQFIGLADHVFSLNWKEDCNKLSNTLVDASRLKDNDIVYCHTMYVKELFEIIKVLNVKLTVISHNCDVNVGSEYIIPPNVKKWFTTNVNMVSDRIESIPIGLENKKWFPKKKGMMIEKLKENRSCRNLVYMNFNIRTNQDKRFNLYKHFKPQSWVTYEYGSNGENFNQYINNIYNHKFVFCPEGNGIDTHRLWETLYMGSIPIVKRSINNSYYQDLPICFVNSWEEVTEDYLNRWDNIKHIWQYDKLKFEYWKNKIKTV